jgi:spore germination protein KC
MKEFFKMARKKTALVFFFITICPFILCGCWNYREIDTLAIVAGMAIDKDLGTNKYTVTSEIITTQMQGVSSIIGSELYISEGESIFTAARNTMQKTGLKLFWNHAKVVVISESLAIEGLIPVIDWLNRSSDVRPDLKLLISKDKNAADILKTKDNLHQVVSYHLDDAMDSGYIISKFADSNVWSFIDGISTHGMCDAVATVKNEFKNGTITPYLSGSAIFKLDKLVGYIDGDETLYMLMIKNKITTGLINLKNISGSPTGITLEIHENKTSLTPLYTNGIASIVIDITPTVSIHEVEGTTDFIKEENLKVLQREAEKIIESKINDLISKLQKNYKSDVLGFTGIFQKEKPKVSEYFNESDIDIFESLKTEVNVNLLITGSSKTRDPIILEK